MIQIANTEKIAKPARAQAEANSSRHGARRSHAGYLEAVTELKYLRAEWGAAEMYKDGDGFVVYAWYDHAGRVRSGREDA